MPFLIRLVLFGTLILVIIIWVWTSISSEPKKVSEAVLMENADNSVLLRIPEGERARRASAVAAWGRYSAQAVDARKALDAALAEVKLWSAEVDPLLTNDEGRLLSGDQSFVTSFGVDWKSPKPDLEQLAKHRTALEGLI
jgi:hypothetical protein